MVHESGESNSAGDYNAEASDHIVTTQNAPTVLSHEQVSNTIQQPLPLPNYIQVPAHFLKYDSSNYLASGAFGMVYKLQQNYQLDHALGVESDANTSYVVKIPKPADAGKNSSRTLEEQQHAQQLAQEDAKQELYIGEALSGVDSPYKEFVLQTHAVQRVDDKNELIEDNLIVSQFMPYGACKNALETSARFRANNLAPLNNLQKFLRHDPHHFCAQGGQSILNALTHTTKAGVLHRDLASRNFLIPDVKLNKQGIVTQAKLMLSDYGLSRKISSNSNYQYIRPPMAKFSVLWSCFEERTKKISSVYSEIYSMKVALIENLNRLIDPGYSDRIHLYGHSDSSGNPFVRIAEKMSDEDVLCSFLKVAQQFIDSHSNMNFKKQIQSYIACYHSFLTTMPPRLATNTYDDAQQVIQQQRSELRAANEQFLGVLIKPEAIKTSVNTLQNLKHNLEQVTAKLELNQPLVSNLNQFNNSPYVSLSTDELAKKINKFRKKIESLQHKKNLTDRNLVRLTNYKEVLNQLVIASNFAAQRSNLIAETQAAKEQIKPLQTEIDALEFKLAEDYLNTQKLMNLDLSDSSVQLLSELQANLSHLVISASGNLPEKAYDLLANDQVANDNYGQFDFDTPKSNSSPKLNTVSEENSLHHLVFSTQVQANPADADDNYDNDDADSSPDDAPDSRVNPFQNKKPSALDTDEHHVRTSSYSHASDLESDEQDLSQSEEQTALCQQFKKDLLAIKSLDGVEEELSAFDNEQNAMKFNL